jgi:hypothetical protein
MSTDSLEVREPLRVSVDWANPLLLPKRNALPRPNATAGAAEKKNYAERLSRAFAEMLAAALRTRTTFRSITPTPDGRGHEASTRVDGGRKKLDVRLLNDELGLVFSASIKTYSFRDYSPSTRTFGRYQKNIVRNDMELRAEADVIHRRQPYAVMAALVFLHEGAASDGENKHSSFAHAVFTFRKRAGRISAQDDRYDRFEKVYIGLFDPDDVTDGAVGFFDVEQPPPRNGKPRDLLTLQQVVDALDHLVKQRNDLVFEYADGTDVRDKVDLGVMTAAVVDEASAGLYGNSSSTET